MDLLQVSALLFGFTGCALTVLSLHNSYWKVSSDDGSVILTSTLFENLWMERADDDSTGSYSCRDFLSLLALPGYCRVSRSGDCGRGFGGLRAGGHSGRDAVCKIGGDNHLLKWQIIAFGGVCFILQGLCMMIAMSWYAFNITQTFFNQLYEGTKYETGQGLYIGWSSGLL